MKLLVVFVLHRLLASSFVGTDILLMTLLSDTLNLGALNSDQQCSFLSEPYNPLPENNFHRFKYTFTFLV